MDQLLAEKYAQCTSTTDEKNAERAERATAVLLTLEFTYT